MLALALDSTQISQYCICPHAWYLRFRQNLAKVEEDKEAIIKGNAFHYLLERYYNSKIDETELNYGERAKKAIEHLRVFNINTNSFNEEVYKFISNRFLSYCIYWENVGDFKPLKKEGSNAVEVGFSKVIYKDADFTFIIEGRIDLIAEVQDHLVFVDHKTQARKSNLYIYKTQFLTYALATELEYGMYNYIGLTKETNNDTFRRNLVHFPKWKVNQWQTYLIHEVFIPIAVRLKKYQYIRENVKSSGLLTYVEEKELNLFSKKLSSCAGAFDSNPCMYTNICESESPALVKSIKAFNYVKAEPWSPWKEE